MPYAWIAFVLIVLISLWLAVKVSRALGKLEERGRRDKEVAEDAVETHDRYRAARGGLVARARRRARLRMAEAKADDE